jgi:hypothetical protein
MSGTMRETVVELGVVEIRRKEGLMRAEKGTTKENFEEST